MSKPPVFFLPFRFPRIFPAVSLAALCLAAPAFARAKVLLGIDVLERENFAPLRGKRVGLIANGASRDGQGRWDAEVLSRAGGVHLAKILSLEHGFFIDTEAAQISSSSLSLEGKTIPIVSLYRGGIAGMRPTPQDLSGLDVLVFDMQDVGARFYTYLASMAMAMEAAKTAGIEFMVLDRPNPITGSVVEGPVLDDASLRQVTPTAYFAVPIRHGLTAGEMARFYNAELKDPRLVVVPMSGWRRAMWYDQTGLRWRPPSPNLPDLDSVALYPGIGIFEASNLSVGRGTPKPFQWVGAPWLDAEATLKDLAAAHLPGVRFAREDLTPSQSLYKGKLCRGIRLSVKSRGELRPVGIFLALNQSLMRRDAAHFAWRWPELKRMVGTEKFHEMLERKTPLPDIEKFFAAQAKAFKKSRRPCLLYR